MFCKFFICLNCLSPFFSKREDIVRLHIYPLISLLTFPAYGPLGSVNISGLALNICFIYFLQKWRWQWVIRCLFLFVKQTPGCSAADKINPYLQYVLTHHLPEHTFVFFFFFQPVLCLGLLSF